LSNRIATAFALANIGGKSALATLRRPLEEKDSPPLVGRDEKPLIAILFAIGNLAQRSDAAFEYLQSRAQTHTKNWPVSGPAIPCDLLLCASSLRALATTGKPGVADEIEKFSEQFSADEIRPIACVIVDAAFLAMVWRKVWSDSGERSSVEKADPNHYE
jgi:hypothetical protein